MNESSKVPNTSASHMPMLTSSFKDRTSADKA